MKQILYLTYPLNGILMLALPIGLAVYLTRRFRMRWELWWIGAAVFFLSQVGHIPFNNWFFGLFEKGILQFPAPSWEIPAYAVLAGLSAGLWEELARYAMYRWWVKKARSWKEGILLGAGHGGCEAIILGVLVLWTFIQLAALRGADLPALLPAERIPAVEQALDQYWSALWQLTLLGAVERLFTLPFHIAASLLVLQAFTRRKIYWLGIAIAWHTFINAAIAGIAWRLLQPYPWGAYAVELLLGLTALINLGIIFALRTSEPAAPASEAALPPPPPQPLRLEEPEITPESLDKTRYNTP